MSPRGSTKVGHLLGAGLLGCALLGLGGCAVAPPAQVPHGGGEGWQALHAGVGYKRFAQLPDSVVHALRIDLHTPGLTLALSPEAERGQPLDAMPSAAGALLSINASYFTRDYSPRGWTLSQGQAWSKTLPGYAGGSPVFACTVKLHCRIELQPPAEAVPADWWLAVAGTPWLLDQGRTRSPADDATCTNHCARAHPRTAIGLDASGRWLFLVLAEGRRPPVQGLSLAELSTLMRGLGADSAINLDGGGSSTLLIEGRSVMARPFNETALRPVANALHVRVAAP